MFINNLNWAKITINTWIENNNFSNLNEIGYEIVDKLNKDERRILKAYVGELLVMHQMVREKMMKNTEINDDLYYTRFYDECQLCATLAATIEMLNY